MASNILSPGLSPAEEPDASNAAGLEVPRESSSAIAAVKELFRRWPAVPSRELERIRRALRQCESSGYAGGGHQLSEPARAALELITAELERRGQTNTPHTPGSEGGS